LCYVWGLGAGGEDSFKLAATHADQRFRCDAGFLFQQSFIDTAEIFHIKRAVMHTHPFAAIRKNPDQAVEQDRHRAFTPFETVEQRRGVRSEQCATQRYDPEFAQDSPLLKIVNSDRSPNSNIRPVSCP